MERACKGDEHRELKTCFEVHIMQQHMQYLFVIRTCPPQLIHIIAPKTLPIDCDVLALQFTEAYINLSVPGELMPCQSTPLKHNLHANSDTPGIISPFVAM